MASYRAKPPKGATINRGDSIGKSAVFSLLLNEGAGPTVYDSAYGARQKGTLASFNFNSSSGWTSGLYGKGLLFDGTDDYIDIAGSSTPLQLNRNFGLFAIITPTTITGNHAIISHGQSGWYFRVSSGKLDFLESQTAGILTGATTLTSGATYFVGVTVSSSGTVNIWLNGKSDASGSTLATINDSTVNVTVGADQQSNALKNEFWQGRMDGVWALNTCPPTKAIRDWGADPFRLARRRYVPVPLKAAAASPMFEEEYLLLASARRW